MLMNRIANGYAVAFAALYDRLAPRVLGLIVCIIGTRRGADDLLQDVFRKAWTSASNYDSERSSPLVWIAMMARSMSLDHIRKEVRESLRRKTIAMNAEKVHVDGSSHSESSSNAPMTNGAMFSLPDDQREAICLAFYCGLTHAQIATSQNLPLGTVKTRIRLGMRRLRELLGEPREATSK